MIFHEFPYASVFTLISEKVKIMETLKLIAQIFKATKGTQIAKDNTSRLHHAASKHLSDTLGKPSSFRKKMPRQLLQVDSQAHPEVMRFNLWFSLGLLAFL